MQADDEQIAYPANRPANADLTYTLVSGNVAGETPAYNGALGYDAALALDPLVPNTYVDAIVGGTLGLLNNGTFKAANYSLVVLPGDLKVVNGGFIVDLTGGSWTYDGNRTARRSTGTEPDGHGRILRAQMTESFGHRSARRRRSPTWTTAR